jgi:hypothetical protein
MESTKPILNEAENGNKSKPLLYAGRVSKEDSGLGTKIEWKSIKIWKPNLIQRILIKLKIIKDKRYDSGKVDRYLLDEAGHWQDPSRDSKDYWNAVK